MNWHPMSEKPMDESALYIIQTSDQGYQAAIWDEGCFNSYPAGEMCVYMHTPDTVLRWALVETGDVHPAELTANDVIDYVVRATRKDYDFMNSVYEQAAFILGEKAAESDGGER